MLIGRKSNTEREERDLVDEELTNFSSYFKRTVIGCHEKNAFSKAQRPCVTNCVAGLT